MSPEWKKFFGVFLILLITLLNHSSQIVAMDFEQVYEVKIDCLFSENIN